MQIIYLLNNVQIRIIGDTIITVVVDSDNNVMAYRTDHL